MTRVLLVHGPRHGETIEVERVGTMTRTRGRGTEVEDTCEGYGPVDSYGMPDPAGMWSVHHRDTETAKVTVAFSHDSLCLSAIEATVLGKTSVALEASLDGVEDAWERYCQGVVLARA